MIESPPTEREDDDPTLGIDFEMYLAFGKGKETAVQRP